MMNIVLETIYKRRSSRDYRTEQISAAELDAILEAGRCAPYAGCPAHLTAVQNAALITKINTAAKQAATQMGMPHLEALGNDPVFIGSYGAPTILIVSDEEGSVAPELNCAAAAQNILIAAEALKLGACWVHFPLFYQYGPFVEEIHADLKLPTGHKACACIALGYRVESGVKDERVYDKFTIIK